MPNQYLSLNIHNPTLAKEMPIYRMVGNGNPLVLRLGPGGAMATVVASDTEWDAIVAAVDAFRASESPTPEPEPDVITEADIADPAVEPTVYVECEGDCDAGAIPIDTAIRHRDGSWFCNDCDNADNADADSADAAARGY